MGAAYLNQGGIEGRDSLGKPTGGYGASDSALGLGWGAKLGSGFVAGAGVKHVQSRIANASAQAFAFDLGLSRSDGLGSRGTVFFGAAVQNLGSAMSFGGDPSPLPLTVSAGAGYRLPAGLLFGLDFRHRLYAGRNEVSIGTEYAVLPAFAVRAGYASGAGAAPGTASTLRSLAAGFGVKARGYALDYSMSPWGELGNVHRLSLGARF